MRDRQLEGGVGCQWPSCVIEDQTWTEDDAWAYMAALSHTNFYKSLGYARVANQDVNPHHQHALLCLMFETKPYKKWRSDPIKFQKVKFASVCVLESAPQDGFVDHKRTTHTFILTFAYLLHGHASRSEDHSNTMHMYNAQKWNRLTALVGVLKFLFVCLFCLKLCLCLQEFQKLLQLQCTNLSTA